MTIIEAFELGKQYREASFSLCQQNQNLDRAKQRVDRIEREIARTLYRQREIVGAVYASSYVVSNGASLDGAAETAILDELTQPMK